jgi:4-amino-4-deoxy-L-arabinose transferase-like glycosyltransferase
MQSTLSLDHTSGRTEVAWSKGLLWIVVFSFALRAAVRLHSGEADFWANSYSFFFEMAESIANGKGIAFHGLATIFRVPLYPIVLAALTFGHKEFLPIVLFQALIGAGTVWCAALIARDLFGNAAAIVAGALTAIYPYYIVHDTALQETSLYAFFTALAVLLLMRARRNGSYLTAAFAGLSLGAALLTRANLGPFVALAPLWLLVGGGSSVASWQRRLGTCLLCAGVIALTYSPWLIRSYWITNSPTLGSEAGFFLWLGNNPYTFSHYPNESIDRSQDVALAELSPNDKAELEALRPNEAAVDNWFLKKGLDYMREHPWLTIASGVRKISAAFCLLPSPRHSFWPNLVYFSSYAPVLILGLYGMWAGRHNWREHLIFYALFASFIGVTAIYFGHTSYRAYLDVYLIVFAAGVLAQLWSKMLSNGRPAPAYLDDAGGTSQATTKVERSYPASAAQP